MPREQVKVIMYSTRFCPYCLRARMLLKSKRIQFEEISVSGDAELWDEMEKRSGRDTVPQIFFGDKPMGGYDDLALLNNSGQLDAFLDIRTYQI